MKKLIVLFAIIAYTGSCFGYTTYFQRILMSDKQGLVQQTWDFATEVGTGWSPVSLSYSLDSYVSSSNTYWEQAWAHIYIYDFKNALINLPRPESKQSGPGFNVVSDGYSSPCNTPGIKTVTLMVYGEAPSPNNEGSTGWARINAYSWFVN